MMLLVDSNENVVHVQLMEEIEDCEDNLDDDDTLQVGNNSKDSMANNLRLIMHVVYVDDVA